MEASVELKGLARAVDDVRADVGAWPAGSMRDVMGAISALVAATQRLQVAAAAHFTRLGAFRADGAVDTAAWLRAGGLSGGAAKAVADAARAVSAVGVVGDAVASGALGVEHAALLAPLADRIAAGTVDASGLAPLLSSTGVPHADYRQRVRAVEIAVGGDDAAGRRARARMNEWVTADGMGVFHTELDPDRHTIVRTALDDLVLAEWRAAKGDTASTPPKLALPQLRADALVEMARRSLSGAGRASGSVRNGRGAPEVIVIVDLDVLRTGEVQAGSVCRLSDGTPIPGETARRIACDAGIIPIVLGSRSEPLDVGAKSRLATPAQWVALRVRSKTCEFHGCGVNADWTRAHHLEPWNRTHRTDIDNLVLVCERHHHMIHEGQWSLTRVDGVTYTRTPSGAYHGPAPNMALAA